MIFFADHRPLDLQHNMDALAQNALSGSNPQHLFSDGARTKDPETIVARSARWHREFRVHLGELAQPDLQLRPSGTLAARKIAYWIAHPNAARWDDSARKHEGSSLCTSVLRSCY